MTSNSLEYGKIWRENNKEYNSKWRKNNPEKAKSISRKAGVKWVKSNPDKYKIWHKKFQKEYATRNPSKIKAQQLALNKKLRLKHCEKCGIKGVRLEGHHFDYSLPDKIITLCVKCHKEEHKSCQKQKKS